MTRTDFGAAAVTLGAICLLAGAAEGCNGIRLIKPLMEGGDDWPVFAGSPSHANASNQPLEPPLVLDWSYDLSAAAGDGSPIVIDSTVFVGNLRGELHAIRVRNGKKIGWVTLGDAIEGSPAVDGNVAIVALSNSPKSLVAFNLADGTIAWKEDYGDIEVTPLVLRGKVYFGNLAGEFFCVEKETGDQVWKYALPHNETLLGFRSSPAGQGSVVVAGADDGAVYAFDAARGTLVWRVETGAGIAAPPSIDSGRVFCGNLGGRITSIALETGKIIWQYEAGSPVYGIVALSGGLALWGTLGGDVVALHERNGSMAWTRPVGVPINTGLVVARSVAYAGTLKRSLLALRLSDGEVVWREEVDGRIKTTPALADGRLFIVTDNRLLLSYREAGK